MTREDSPPSAKILEEAERLYLALLCLMRRMRTRDATLPLGQAAFSALTTLMTRGPLRLGELADAEGVRPATMSRLVRRLTAEGLVVRRPSPTDGRAIELAHSSRAVALLEQGREARSRGLAADIAALTPVDRAALSAALPVLDVLGRGRE